MRIPLNRRGLFPFLVASLVLAAAVFAVFAQTMGFDLIHYDDPLYLAPPHGKSGIGLLNNLIWAFSGATQRSSYFAPLTWLTFLADSAVYGLNPGGRHLTNLLFHALNSILLFAALRRLTGAPWRSFFVAALFAVHPLHVEAVAWISGRKHLVAGFFWMLALLWHAEHGKKPEIRTLLKVAAACALACMASPMAVTLPFALLLLDFWPLGRLAPDTPLSRLPRAVWPLVREKALLFGISLCAAIAAQVTQTMTEAVAPPGMFSLGTRTAAALWAYLEFLSDTLLPMGLSIIYIHPDAPGLFKTLLAVFVVTAATLAGFAARGKAPWLLTGWLWFLGVLFPMSGIIVIGPHARADRYTYMSLVGVFILLSWGLPALLSRMRRGAPAAALLGAVVTIGMAAAAQSYARCYEDTRTVFERALEVEPQSYVAHGFLGSLAEQEGRVASAAAHFEAALAVNPRFAVGIEHLAALYLKMKQPDKALKLYLDTLKRFGDECPGVFLNSAGALLMAKGDKKSAEMYFLMAVERDPSLGEAFLNLGDLRASRKEYEDAAGYYLQALIDPSSETEARTCLGRSMLALGHMAEAAFHFERVLAKDPKNAVALNGLGVTYAKAGRTNEAQRLFEAALRVNPAFNPAKANLARLKKEGGAGK
jgi:tetratricopeptide (TPR) repeat protein